MCPLGWLYQLGAQCYRALFWVGLKTTHRASLPVVVVGNLTVGGAGKTPTIVALIDLLRQHGLRPAVISRGYGGTYQAAWVRLTVAHRAHEVGDEPMMLFKKKQVPVVVARQRYLAAAAVVATGEADIILMDDGLQHHPLSKDIEVVVVDGQHGFGNQRCLPAGPLRESLQRLKTVDFVLQHGGEAVSGAPMMHWEIDTLYRVADDTVVTWDMKMPVVALAGIGFPQRFEQLLEHAGYNVVEFLSFQDHHVYTYQDIERMMQWGHPVIMTEKDAIKIRNMALPWASNLMYLTVALDLPMTFQQQFIAKVRGVARDF